MPDLAGSTRISEVGFLTRIMSSRMRFAEISSSWMASAPENPYPPHR